KRRHSPQRQDLLDQPFATVRERAAQNNRIGCGVEPSWQRAAEGVTRGQAARKLLRRQICAVVLDREAHAHLWGSSLDRCWIVLGRSGVLQARRAARLLT